LVVLYFVCIFKVLIISESVSSFLTAHQHIIGYSVPEMADSKRTST